MIIKVLLLVLFAVTALIGSAWSQDTTINNKNIQLHKGDRIFLVEHLVFKEGKLYHGFRGSEHRVDSILRLGNGIQVQPNGLYKAPNGLLYNLQEGEYFDMQGDRYASIFTFNAGKKMTAKEIARKQQKIGNR
jgi:hypothetical protein